MTYENKIKFKYDNNNCELRIPVPFHPITRHKMLLAGDDGGGQNVELLGAVGGYDVGDASCLGASAIILPEADMNQKRYCRNFKNCDIFWDENNFLMYIDVRLFRFQAERTFDLKDEKNIKVKYNTKEQVYEVTLPCLPLQDEHIQEITQSSPSSNFSDCFKFIKSSHYENLWKLRKLTDKLTLYIDDEIGQFDSNFDYGFASKFHGPPQSIEGDLSVICKMPNPHETSPLQRTIDREIDEMKHFSREQYKLNFVELNIPEGHDNPMKFMFNFDNVKLTQDEECLLHNLTCKPEYMCLTDNYDQIEIDCGLVSILLAICYDVRVTSNEPTCESGWTRSILSATLSYFEPFNSIKEVVISFLRRSLTYPLYRNYDLGRLCIDDAIRALQKNPLWIIQQLLVTHSLFQLDDNGREPLNHYYIEDYIRYVKNFNVFTISHRQIISNNLKNVLFDIVKKNLRLNLAEIETELLREIVNDMHMDEASNDSDRHTDGHTDDDTDDIDEEEEEDEEENDDDDECEEDEDDNEEDEEDPEDEDETDSSSETEENSVIEQKISNLKIEN